MMQALQRVVNSAKHAVKAKYRNDPAVFFIAEDDTAVITTHRGEVIAAFRLSEAQLQAALKDGNVW